MGFGILNGASFLTIEKRFVFLTIALVLVDVKFIVVVVVYLKVQAL